MRTHGDKVRNITVLGIDIKSKRLEKRRQVSGQTQKKKGGGGGREIKNEKTTTRLKKNFKNSRTLSRVDP